MPRGFRLGRRHSSQSEHDEEIRKLISQGLSINDIAARLKVTRQTIYNAKQRIDEGKLEQAKEQGKELREYKSLGLDEYENLPDLSKWVTNLRARGVKGWRIYVQKIRIICQELQIYPAMLDLEKVVEWKAKHDDMNKKSMRFYNNILKSFLVETGRATPSECKAKGINAKHYNDDEFAHLQLTEKQINEAEAFLSSYPPALAVFKMGTEVCSSKQMLDDISPGSFMVLSDGTQVLRTYREKSKKSAIQYPKSETIAIWKTLPVLDSDGSYFRDSDLTNGITDKLRECYKQIGMTEPYAMSHTLHALRHFGAQRLLANQRVNYNYEAAAELGVWDPVTLRHHYGAIPSEVIHRIGKGLWN